MSNTLLYAAIGLGVAALALVIVSWATYWYEIDNQLLGIKAETQYFWQKYTIKSGGQSVSHTYSSDGDDKLKQLFNVCLILLTVGGIAQVVFIVLVALRVFVLKKSGFMRWLGAIAGIVATVFLSVAFFSFLHLPQAFQDDSIGGSCKDYACGSFLGSKNSQKWGPGVGWWVLLGAIVFSSIATVNALRKARG